MFVLNHQITLSIDEADYPLQRESDQYLMEAAELAGFSAQELLFIDYCRLYLNVISIANISDASGQLINLKVFHLNKLPHGKKLVNMVNQGLLTSPVFSFWLNSLVDGFY